MVPVAAGWRGVFFFASRRRHTRCSRDWSSDVCSSDLNSFMQSTAGGYILHVREGCLSLLIRYGGQPNLNRREMIDQVLMEMWQWLVSNMAAVWSNAHYFFQHSASIRSDINAMRVGSKCGLQQQTQVVIV